MYRVLSNMTVSFIDGFINNNVFENNGLSKKRNKCIDANIMKTFKLQCIDDLQLILEFDINIECGYVKVKTYKNRSTWSGPACYKDFYIETGAYEKLKIKLYYN